MTAKHHSEQRSFITMEVSQLKSQMLSMMTIHKLMISESMASTRKSLIKKIEDCINLRMKYFQIKATLKKDGLIGDEVDTAEGRKKLYAKVHRIKVKLG